MTASSDEVWHALVEHRDRAARVARARGARPDDVDDCVQEAMARVAAMESVDLRRVGSLITVVVANLAVDGYRDRDRAARLEDRLSARPVAAQGHDEHVCDRAEARWLWSLRDSLGEQDRRVLELRAQGHTLTEAAAELGVTYKAAENALGRARKRLRAAWAATTAILGILWGHRPKGPAAKAPALSAALAGLSTLALLSPAPSAPIGPGPLTSPRAAHVTELAAGPERPDAAPAPAQAPAAPPAAVAPTGPLDAAPPQAAEGTSQTLVETAPVEVLEHTLTPPDVERHDDDRTFVEEVQDCLEDGPVVRPDFVGCPR